MAESRLGCGRPWRGFALVEALVASVLAAVVIVAVLPAFARAAQSIRSARQLTRATLVAEGVMGDLLGDSWRATWVTINDACDPREATRACVATGAAATAGGCGEAGLPRHGDHRAVVLAWEEAASSLPEGSVSVTVRGIGAPGGDGLEEEPLAAAVVLQVTATVAWRHGGRRHSVVLQCLRS